MVMKNFVVFEGIDGTGTTTQTKILKEYLKNNNLENKFNFSSEPTPLATGKFLRQVLKGEIEVTNETSVYLFAADRQEHIFGKGGIKEQTDAGKIAISDRYFFSSLAYQGISCGKELPYEVNKVFPLPEILFFFEIDPEISLERIAARGEQTEIFEKKDYLTKTAAAYEEIISFYEKQKNTDMKIIRIDATKTREEIFEIIWTELSLLPILK